MKKLKNKKKETKMVKIKSSIYICVNICVKFLMKM